MKEREYLKKRAELQEECQRKLEALDLVWAMFNTGPTPSTSKALSIGHSDPSTPDADWPFSISKRDAVREALTTLSVPSFTAREIRATLTATNPDLSEKITDNQLSSIVSRLADMGEITVLRKKIGRSPAVYELALKKETADVGW